MNKFKLTLVSVATAALLLPAVAQAQLSFNIGAVSLYKLYGVDQDMANKNWRPALQGGVDYAFDNGFYVGNWNSTGKFGDADLEIDLYGGYRGEITKGLGYDVGFASYLYPSSGGDWNGNEVYFSLSYGPVSARITRGVSGSIDKYARLSLAYAQPLTDKLTFKAGLGFRNTAAGNFDDYSLGLSYDLGNALALSGTIAGATKQNTVADGSRDNRLFVGINKSF